MILKLHVCSFVQYEGLLLGFPLDDFASTLEREACEARSLLNRLADMLVQESAKDLKRNGLQEQNTSTDDEEKHSTLVKSQNLLKQFSLTSGMPSVNRKSNSSIIYLSL